MGALIATLAGAANSVNSAAKAADQGLSQGANSILGKLGTPSPATPQATDPTVGLYPQSNPAAAPTDPNAVSLQDLYNYNQAPSSPAISMSDLAGTPPPPNIPNLGNPYTPYDGTAVTDPMAAQASSQPQPTPQAAAPSANQYVPPPSNQSQAQMPMVDPNQAVPPMDASQPPIGVIGDTWKPHKEGWLGKILDAVSMADGRVPMFHEENIHENERTAMHGYVANPQTEADRAANQRVISRIGSLDPNLAMQLAENQARGSYFQSAGDARQDAQRDKGVTMLSQVFGPGGMLAPTNENAATNYKNMLPLLQKMGNTYGIPDDMLKTMLPPEYDPVRAATVAASGVSGYDQLRAGIMQANSADEIANRDTNTQLHGDEIDLRKQSLGVEMYNANTSAARAQSEIQKNNVGSLTQRSKFYQNVLGGAARVPWLYGGFMKGVFGSGSSGVPKPGVAYFSPDKTMAAKMGSDGSWKIYDTSKNKNGLHARLINTLPGVLNTGQNDGSDDFSNGD